MSYPFCDHCEQVATQGALDLQEVETPGDWAKWKIIPGSERWGCAQHPVSPSLSLRLDGHWYVQYRYGLTRWTGWVPVLGL
jgi:hypothetical protein